jgi:hypothetical protein
MDGQVQHRVQYVPAEAGQPALAKFVALGSSTATWLAGWAMQFGKASASPPLSALLEFGQSSKIKIDDKIQIDGIC